MFDLSSKTNEFNAFQKTVLNGMDQQNEKDKKEKDFDLTDVPSFLKVIKAEEMLGLNAVYETEIKKDSLAFSRSQYVFVQNQSRTNKSSLDENEHEHESIPQESSIGFKMCAAAHRLRTL